MKAPDDALSLCMADTRCRLCQFDIEEHDLVVARQLISTPMLSIEIHPKVGIDSQRLSAPWEFEEIGEAYNAVENVVFHQCFRGRCSRRVVPFFHAECLSLRPCDLSDALIASGEYTFDPYKYEQKRRANRVQSLLTPRLRDNLGTRLPDEVLTMIAGLLIRECATVIAQEMSLGAEIPEDSVDLLRDIYVRYTTVEGVRYVRSISNSRSEHDQHVLVSKEAQAVRKIWIAEDYRGIRFVKFYSANTELPGPTPMKDSWWRAISAPCSIDKINIKTDGVKIRDISVPDETNSDVTVEQVSWASPDHPTQMINLETLSNTGDYPKGLRMTSFDCNIEGVTGYTVVTDGECIAWIHAHGPDDNIEFCAEMEASYPCGFFIYMPVDDGEFVTEICRRYLLDPGSDPSVCLVFITNKGRSTLFGTTRPPHLLNDLETILKPAPEGSRIYFNAWKSADNEKVNYLAFKNPNPPAMRPLPPSHIQSSPDFIVKSNEHWFTSSCSLEGIVDMTLCRDISHSRKPIMGILFTYEDGHRECLGSFRFDTTLEKIRVDQTSDIYIRSLSNMWDHLYVAEVITSSPTTGVPWHWMQISRTGTLEWWWSYRHTALRHISPERILSNTYGSVL